MSKLSNIDELEKAFDALVIELSAARDRLDQLKDDAEELLGNCNDALDSIEYARDALSRTL